MIGGPALAGTISAIARPATSLLVGGRADARGDRPDRAHPRDGHADRQPSSRPLREIAATGLRHVLRTPPLRAVTAAGAINLGGIGLLTVAFPFFALDDLGADRSGPATCGRRSPPDRRSAR